MGKFEEKEIDPLGSNNSKSSYSTLWAIIGVLFVIFCMLLGMFELGLFSVDSDLPADSAQERLIDRKLRSTDAFFSVQIPSDWEILPILEKQYPGATLVAGNLRKEQYFIVTREEKTASSFTLEQLAKIKTEFYSTNPEDYEISPITEIAAGNLMAAESKIASVYSNIDIVIFQYVVITGSAYYTALAWTTKRLEKRALTRFRRVIKSFSELQP